MRVNQLHKSAQALPNRLHVTGVQMPSQGEMAIDHVRVVLFAKLTESLSQVVDHETVVIREEFHSHLGNLPAREIEVDSVEKSKILTDNLRQWHEQVRRPNHHVDRLVSVAVK